MFWILNKEFHYLISVFFPFLNIKLLFILHTNPKIYSLTFSHFPHLLSFPSPILYSEEVRPVLRSHQSLTYQLEAGLSPFSMSRLSMISTIGNRFEKKVYAPGIGFGATVTPPTEQAK